jgi:hypothetical protein
MGTDKVLTEGLPSSLRLDRRDLLGLIDQPRHIVVGE